MNDPTRQLIIDCAKLTAGVTRTRRRAMIASGCTPFAEWTGARLSLLRLLNDVGTLRRAAVAMVDERR